MRWVACLVLVLGATVATGADLIVRQQVTVSAGPGAGPREQTLYFTPTRVVVDGDRDRTIVDLSSRTMTLVDETEKTWFTMSTDQLRAQAEAVQQEMQRRIADMPPEARAEAERMMAGGQPAPAVTATGKRETIAGYEAAEYRVQAGAFSGTVWGSDAVPVPAGLAQWKEMSLGASPAHGPGRGLAEAFAKVPGFPMRTTMSGGTGRGAFSSTTEVLDVRQGTVPADVLAVPEGFRKIDPPTAGGTAARTPRGK